jgi:hypothetical protein
VLQLSSCKPEIPELGCVRCGGAVFANESLVSNGRLYHRERCAKCNECDRKLDSNTLYAGEDRVRTGECKSVHLWF